MASESSAADAGTTGPGDALEDRVVYVSPALSIPRGELAFRASRSSGAGGQHVNKTSSRVEALWNVRTSPSLDDAQRARLLARLGTRLSDDGELRVVSSETRSQHRNRELSIARLADIVRAALAVPRTRKPTRPTRASKQARLEAKRRHSDKKRDRRRDTND